MSGDFVYPPITGETLACDSCIFYPHRVCIEFVKGDDRPCEVCDITIMYWKEKRLKLQARWLREGIEKMEKLKSGEQLI